MPSSPEFNAFLSFFREAVARTDSAPRSHLLRVREKKAKAGELLGFLCTVEKNAECPFLAIQGTHFIRCTIGTEKSVEKRGIN